MLQKSLNRASTEYFSEPTIMGKGPEAKKS